MKKREKKMDRDQGKSTVQIYILYIYTVFIYIIIIIIIILYYISILILFNSILNYSMNYYVLPCFPLDSVDF